MSLKSVEAKFDELTPERMKYKESRIWLTKNPSLYKEEPYPESMLELDNDKVKEFIRTSFLSLIEELEAKLPGEKNKPHTEPIPELKGWDIGFNTALSQIRSIIKELEVCQEDTK